MKISFVIRRLLLVVPTVILILFLSFVLQSLAPGDEIAKQIEVEGSSRALSKTTYLNEYRRLSNRYGMDQPMFYIGLRPSYFPDTLNRIIPKGKRLLLTSLLRQSKDWKAVSTIDRHIKNLIINLDDSKGDAKIIYNEILKMEQDKSLSDLKSRCYKIKSFNFDIDSISSDVGLLINHVEALTSSSIFSYPILNWNGSQNQFHNWLRRLFSKNDNISLVDATPALDKIYRALKWTVTLSLISLILIALFSLLIGYLQVRFRDGIFDRISTIVLYIFYTIPTFWLATLLVVFFTTPDYGAWTDIFPSIGLKPSFVDRSFMSELADNLGQLILPIICLVLVSIPYLAIQLKSDLIDTLSKPYTLMARAKGLSYKQLLRSHSLPNALVPYITVLAGALPGVFTGSVIIEVIFNIPGVGKLLMYSVEHADWPVVFTIVVVISITTMLGYLLGDLLLMKLYPKTKESFGGSSSS